MGTSTSYRNTHHEHRLLRIKNHKTYEIWTRREANVRHFKIFGSKCYIKREDKQIGKFDPRVGEEFFRWIFIQKEILQMTQFDIRQGD